MKHSKYGHTDKFKVGDVVISISNPDFWGVLVVTNTELDNMDGSSILIGKISDLEDGSWWTVSDLRHLTKLEKAMW